MVGLPQPAAAPGVCLQRTKSRPQWFISNGWRRSRYGQPRLGRECDPDRRCLARGTRDAGSAADHSVFHLCRLRRADQPDWPVLAGNAVHVAVHLRPARPGGARRPDGARRRGADGRRCGRGDRRAAAADDRRPPAAASRPARAAMDGVRRRPSRVGDGLGGIDAPRARRAATIAGALRARHRDLAGLLGIDRSHGRLPARQQRLDHGQRGAACS